MGKVIMTCVNLDLRYKFNKVCDEGMALKFLKSCAYSPTVRVIGYSNDALYPLQDIEYWFSRQVQYILPILEYVRQFPFYVKEVR